MKKILLLLLTLTSSALAQDFNLSGDWISTNSHHSLKFILVGNTYHLSSQERFVYPNRSLSHTIDQHLKVPRLHTRSIKGSVDFYDSRGCSFKDLPVKIYFESPDVVNVLMTVPRYVVQKITTGPVDGYYRPRYCTAPGRYGRPSYQYICSSEYVRPSVRVECRLLEHIEIPVQLERAQDADISGAY